MQAAQQMAIISMNRKLENKTYVDYFRVPYFLPWCFIHIANHRGIINIWILDEPDWSMLSWEFMVLLSNSLSFLFLMFLLLVLRN